MRTSKVAIIGGGPGGLFTAYLLQKRASQPIEIVIFEASSRLGGKILTPTFDAGPLSYEAGAAELYDYSHHDEDPLKELVKELGLTISPMGGSSLIINDQVVANLDDVEEAFGQETRQRIAEFDQVAKGWCTAEEFYESDYPDGYFWSASHETPPTETRFDSLLREIRHPDARRYVELLIHSDLATEPQRTTCHYGIHNYVMNDPAYMQLYGIDGGNERLPQALAERIHAVIRLQEPVYEIQLAHHSNNDPEHRRSSHQARTPASPDRGPGPSPLRVRSRSRTEHREETFDYVVVALPHNQLASLNYQDQRLRTAVDQHIAYYDYPAHYLRVTLLFQTPFWRSQLSDSYWMIDRFGGCCLYDESSRKPDCESGILGWLIAGENAAQLESHSDADLIAMVLQALPPFLSHGVGQFIEGKVHRWKNSVNAIPGGIVPKSLDQRHRPDPVHHPNLFFVGDYLFDSTLNGVMDSASFVADWLVAEINET